MSRTHPPIPELQQQVDRLFGQVAALDDVEARRFLASIEVPPEVLERVLELIDAGASSDSGTVSPDGLLGSRADFAAILGVADHEDVEPTDLTGTTVANLLFLQRLGFGGMGDIYLAEDVRLRRHVAVKVINDRFRLEQRAKDRLRREARILSQLDHPGICRIFSLEETPSQDFLVLEYVDGQTLRSWLENKPGNSRKLRVAAGIVSAICAAHEAGIIHRDLKPDNIMILPDDATKILDFGISRILQEPMDTAGAAAIPLAPRHPAPVMEHTVQGAMMGTLQFMSPEQANGDPVGTPADIYSLGILLQCMFSSTPAYPRLHQVTELLQKTRSGQTAPITGVSQDLRRLIERMKSVAPAARPTAADVAVKLARIQQKPRRRLQQMLAACLAGMFLLLGAKYTLDLRHEREQSEQARLEAEQVSDFLINLFSISDPDESKGREVTARELLDRGASSMDAQLALQPEVLARLKNTMGQVYLALGLYDSSRAQLRQSLELSAPVPHGANYLTSLVNLGYLELEAGNYAEAEQWLSQALGSHFEPAVTDKVDMLDARNILAAVYARTDRLDEALKLNLEVLALHEQAPLTDFLAIARASNNVAMQYWRMEQLPEAETYMRKAVESLDRSNNDDLSTEASLLSNLSLVLTDLGQLAEAEELAEAAVQIRRKMHPGGHSGLALAYDNLSVTQRKAGLLQRAEVSNLIALEIYAQTDGRQHSNYAWTLANRAVILQLLDRPGEAEVALLEAIAIFSAAVGAVHSKVAEYESRLAGIYLDQGRLEAARKHSEIAVATYRTLNMNLSTSMAQSWLQLSSIQQQLGEFEAARATLSELIALLGSGPDIDPEIDPEIDPDIVIQARSALANLGTASPTP